LEVPLRGSDVGTRNQRQPTVDIFDRWYKGGPFAMLEPMSLLTWIWPAGLVVSGAAIGFLVGMTGVGAGSLTTPLLISVFHLPPAVAVGTDLLFAAITKSTAAWRFQKHKNIDWSVLGWLAAGSLPGAILTLAWLKWAHPDTTMLASLIRKALGVILILSAIANALYPWLIRSRGVQSDAPPPRARRRVTIVLGLVIGVMVVLTSVGAGAIGVAALMLIYPTLNVRRLIGTDVVHAIPLAAVAGLGHLGLGSIDLRVLGLLLLGSVPGIYFGTRVTGVAPDWVVRWALAVVLLLAAVLVLSK
jgi:uncharacterized protein